MCKRTKSEVDDGGGKACSRELLRQRSPTPLPDGASEGSHNETKLTLVEASDTSLHFLFLFAAILSVFCTLCLHCSPEMCRHQKIKHG